MSTRPVVSYDDITLPYDPVEPPAAAPQPSPHPEQPPPAKKRKKNNQKGKNRANQHNHQNQPRGQQQQNRLTNAGARSTSQQYQQQQEEYDESMQDDYDYSYAEGDAEEGEEEEEESRELTHDEIWDDSALLYAWESAMEEYEAYHGPGQDWKKEPVKKSPLWYNVPPDLSKKAAKASAATAASTASAAAADDEDEAEADSKPLDFDTFVPTHDPSLYPATSSSSALPADVAAGQAPQVDYVPEGGVPSGMVSQDEAFQRALSATYWAGYWTAMYHAQKQFSQSQKVPIPQASTGVADQVDAEAEVETEDVPEEGEEIEVDNEDELVSTQR